MFPPYRGGISKHSSLIYSHLCNKHNVQALNFKKLYPGIFFPGKSQYDYELGETGKKILSSTNFLTWFRTVKVIKKYNPDVLLFKFWHPFFVPAYNFIIKRIKKRCKANIIMVCDNILPHEKFPFSEFMIKSMIKNVDGFIVQSSIVERQLKALNPSALYVKRFHPIYDSYPKKINKALAKEMLKIKKSKVVLFFGFVREYKGLDILIKSMDRVFEKNNDMVLLIAGECYSSKKKYINLISKTKYKKNIIWIDEFISDKDVSKYFSSSDVVVLPYRTASQSGVIPLAYHYNKPVISSDLESLKEVILEGKTGYTFKTGSMRKLQDKIFNFFDNYDSDLYQKNIIKYKNTFSWDFFISGIEEVVDRLNERS